MLLLLSAFLCCSFEAIRMDNSQISNLSAALFGHSYSPQSIVSPKRNEVFHIKFSYLKLGLKACHVLHRKSFYTKSGETKSSQFIARCHDVKCQFHFQTKVMCHFFDVNGKEHRSDCPNKSENKQHFLVQESVPHNCPHSNDFYPESINLTKFVWADMMHLLLTNTNFESSASSETAMVGGY